MDCRIFVEKKSGFDLEPKSLLNEIKENFKINLTDLRILNIYDIFNINESEKENAIKGIFSEIVCDEVYSEINLKNEKYFAVEFLPGQFDQRADSAMQCLNLLSTSNKDVTVTSGKLLIFNNNISNEELNIIKNYYINPVEMREKNLEVFKLHQSEKALDVPTIENFINFTEDEMKNFAKDFGLAMTLADILFTQKYFRDTEKRNPTETEIKVLDTYWSDHCRHTTFETILKSVTFSKDEFGKTLQNAFDNYLKDREFVHGERLSQKNITLMDMATISAKQLRKLGKLDDLEVSNEINACSVFVDVDVDDKIEKWLLMFKNETHNHPTEIEPFGGASTCLGGAIRDPLSGRSYVYQAIRVTGAGNPLEKLDDTLVGKLPQKKITKGAANGYSSYGNQIGLTTGLVAEIYDDGYKAKRMEVGAVVGAVPASFVRREDGVPSDVVILIGGKTGRDGCGGATGSSKEHNDNSLELSGAEVQKGNAPEERKIQRLFRNEKVTRLIKKCNDFGAGGVAVAIGEIADGLEINLDKVPTKYDGLSGTELAISESQERMAILLDKKDVKEFTDYCISENLLATEVAVVTENNRLVMLHKGKKIVDISRDFLDTSGVTGEIDVDVETIDYTKNVFDNFDKSKNINDNWAKTMKDLNVVSQKGLVEMFDNTIGASTVLMPFGGKYETTPNDVSVQKLPVLNGETKTASAITFGYNPKISKWSPYHGAEYAVVESLSKLVSIGCDYKTVRLSFQEYFQRLGTDPKNWGKPFSALLGSINAQKAFETPAIGGKDSMSGTFNELHVPPTLISFAVTTINVDDVISSEFKGNKNNIYLVKHTRLENQSPNYEQIKNNFEFMLENIKNKKIISASAVKYGGISETLTKMSFGNKIGIDIKTDENLFEFGYGSFIIESEKELKSDTIDLIKIGTTSSDCYSIKINDSTISIEDLEKEWQEKLAPVFPYTVKEKLNTSELVKYHNNDKVYVAKNKIAKPKVIIPVFPGTNCEYDCKKVFEREGASTEMVLIRNVKSEYIEQSIRQLEKEIKTSQILMFPGGFSSGDEPDGSGKFIATVISNPQIKEAIYEFLDNDGLILGICNGFQALIKSGLLPYGKIGDINEDSPTLTFNKIGRHISQMARTRIASTNSPWLSSMNFGDEHVIPVSHGEGRFYANEEVIKELFANGQVATQYVDLDGRVTNEFKYNPNGSSYGIEGILSPDGKIFGKMGHSERVGYGLYKNVVGDVEQNIFRNGVGYFR